MTNTIYSNASRLFPSLSPNIKLNLYASSGIVLVDNPPKPIYLSNTTADLLSKCNGTNSFEEIISQFASENSISDGYDTYKSLLELIQFSEQGYITLNEKRLKKSQNENINKDTIYPLNIQVELTTLCNLKCHYCYRKAGKEGKNRLETKQLLSILDTLFLNGLQSVELTGGEPTLHPDFLEILEFCYDRVQLIGLMTNGTVLSKNLVKKLLPYKEKLVISISLDSHKPEIHDIRRGVKGAFNKTCKGIKLIAKHGFITRVSMAVDEETWEDVEETLLLSKKLGAGMFTYGPVLPFGNAKNHFHEWKFNAKAVAEKEKTLKAKYKDYIQLLQEDTMEKLNSPGSCGAGYRSVAMAPNGEIRPCVTFDENYGIMGSLKDSSIDEVFSNQTIKLMSELKAPTYEVCKECKWTFFCMYCSLRGLMASDWVEECNWSLQPDVINWKESLNTA